MKRLAEELYKQIKETLGLQRCSEACIVGCAKAFAQTPEIEVIYVLHDPDGNWLGGILDARFKSGFWGGYTVAIIRDATTVVHLTKEDNRRLGFAEQWMAPVNLEVSPPLCDAPEPWLLHHSKGTKTFTEDIATDFKSFIRGLVGTTGNR